MGNNSHIAILETEGTDSIIRSSWSWNALIFLLPITLFFYMAYTLFPIEEIGDIVWLCLISCAGIISVYSLIRSFYRIIIDKYGVKVQRLIAKRYYAWDDIRQIIISARLHDRYRWIGTATFSTKYLSQKELNHIMGPYDRKCMISVDLADSQIHASKMYPYIDRNRFLEFLRQNKIDYMRVPTAEKAGEKRGFF